MKQYLSEELVRSIASRRRQWLVTGAAGFIGSNLVETLLRLDQDVRGLDNFSTGNPENLADVSRSVSPEQWTRFEFIEGDIRDFDVCRRACEGQQVVLHQAALGSVPRSIANPLATHQSNVDGYLHMLIAARDAQVDRFIYAASSSTYGDSPALPKRENVIGKPLSPYAVSKYVNELYAGVFFRTYGIKTIGLRYFNVFGGRQDPEGAYAAVVPKWINAMLAGETCQVYGDGETSRDFCFVANAVQANLRASLVDRADAFGEVYNVAAGAQTTLNQMFSLIRARLVDADPSADTLPRAPEYRDFRGGDVRHSLADISKARQLLGFAPTHDVGAGMTETVRWYMTKRSPIGSR